MAATIGEGSAQGGIAYLDSLIDKGRVPATMVSPLKTALKKILEQTEGESWPSADMRTLDIADTMARFKNLTMGRYSPGSYRTYELRLVKAAEWYRNFLKNPGWYPGSGVRSAPAATENPKSKTVAEPPGNDPYRRPVDGGLDNPDMLTYPFPMSGGRMARLYIPRAVSSADILRLTSFLEALVVEDAGA